MTIGQFPINFDAFILKQLNSLGHEMIASYGVAVKLR